MGKCLLHCNHLLQRNLVTVLESSVTYLEQAERYEMMSEIFKLLQPFYEKARDFEKMKEMYGKLHVAFKRVVEIMATGKRYLGTYFRVAFYGKVKSCIQYIRVVMVEYLSVCLMFVFLCSHLETTMRSSLSTRSPR